MQAFLKNPGSNDQCFQKKFDCSKIGMCLGCRSYKLVIVRSSIAGWKSIPLINALHLMKSVKVYEIRWKCFVSFPSKVISLRSLCKNILLESMFWDFKFETQFHHMYSCWNMSFQRAFNVSFLNACHKNLFGNCRNEKKKHANLLIWVWVPVEMLTLPHTLVHTVINFKWTGTVPINYVMRNSDEQTKKEGN